MQDEGRIRVSLTPCIRDARRKSLVSTNVRSNRPSSARESLTNTRTWLVTVILRVPRGCFDWTEVKHR